MDSDLLETLFFQRCSDLDGRQHLVQVGRRNGRPTPLMAPSWTDPADQDQPDDTTNNELREELCYSLSRKQRQTWLKLIHGQSILAIAIEEHVTRQAIYSRIRGTRRTKGMIDRNYYVARWWKLRERARQRGLARETPSRVSAQPQLDDFSGNV